MEISILYALQELHRDWLNSLMIFITTLGDGGIVWILASLVMLCFKRTRKCGFLTLLTMGLCLIFGNLLLKNLVARPRPFAADPSVQLLIPAPGEYSFPSGHTMHGFGAATMIFLHNKRIGMAALFLAALIAFSRLYLFVHFPTDILGGILVGAAAALAVYNVDRKRRKAQAEAAGN